MTVYTIGKNDAGRRADRFVAKVESGLGSHQVQKLFRKKDVKLNGRPCKPDTRLPEGGELMVYGAFSAAPAPNLSILPATRPDEIVYEDENLLLLWKPPGLLSQPGRPEDSASDTVEGRVRRYLSESGQWNPKRENTFTPSLCHRLDRGTEGLVMAAKTAEALRVLTEKIRTREIRKTYRCVVHGQPSPKQGLWEDYLFKDAKKGHVYARVSQPGAKYAALRYQTLDTQQGNDGGLPPLSLMEIDLLTGRTHQIRVQFATRGYPLVGDRRYGSPSLDRLYKPEHPALCATCLAFAFTTPAGSLENLSGRVFERKKTFDVFRKLY